MMPAGRAIICPDIDAKYVLSSDAVRFEFSSELDKHYLYYAINSPVFRDQVYGEVQGITRVRTSLNKLRTYILPIPPLEEQKRIVAKIEELLPLVDEYDKAAGELKALNEVLPDKLRKSVLQEAIHGNLVPNEIPEGEATAQELLQQILKERQDRENAAKGKKAKKLTLSEIEEEPWELPEGWCWCKLEDVSSTNGGFAFKSAEYSKEGYRVIRISDFNEQGFVDKAIVRFPYNERLKGYLLQEKDILLCMTGGTVGKSLFVKSLNEQMLVNQRVATIRAIKILPEYLNVFIKSPQVSQIVDDCKNSTNDNISMGDILGLDFPLPPLSIQKAIVAKIEEVFAAIDKLK